MRTVLIRILVSMLLALSVDARAQGLLWHSTGPGGGGAFASASQSKWGQVLIASDLSGAYRSVDGGAHWQILGADHGLQVTHVDATGFSMRVPGVAFLGGEDGFYASTNCEVRADAPCVFQRRFEGYVTAMAVGASGAKGEFVYAAGLSAYCVQGPQIWVSANSGAVFKPTAARGLPRDANIMALRVEPGDAQTILVISSPERAATPRDCGADKWPHASPRRAFISTNGGDDFVPFDVPASTDILKQTDAASGASWGTVEDVKFDLARPGRIWLTVLPDVAIDSADARDNAGELWMSDGPMGAPHFERLSTEHSGQIWPLSDGDIRLLDIRRQKPWLMKPYADSDQTGFWQWSVTGKSFTHVTSPEDYARWDLGWNGPIHAPLGSLNGSLQSLTPVDDQQAWWIDEQFAFKTSDGGHVVAQAFTNDLGPGKGFVSRKIDNAVPVVLEPSLADPNVLYAGYLDMGCWSTTAALASEAELGWQDCNGPKATLEQGKPIAWSPLNGWWEGYGGDTTAIAPDPVNANAVWAVHAPHKETTGAPERGFYRIAKSSDGFAHWDDLTFNLNDLDGAAAVTALVVQPHGEGKRQLWALAGDRLYTLPDGAGAWQVVTTGACDGSAQVMALKTPTFLIGGADGVCFSRDGGATWHWWRNGISFGAPQPVWWGAWDDGARGVTDFAFDPEDGRHVFMTVMEPDYANSFKQAGLYQSRDGGESWTKVIGLAEGPFESNFMRTVAVNPVDPKMIVVGTSSAIMAGGYFPKARRMGVFVSRDGGQSWPLRPENAGLAWPFITKLRFAVGLHPRLFGISPGQGIIFTDVE